MELSLLGGIVWDNCPGKFSGDECSFPTTQRDIQRPAAIRIVFVPISVPDIPKPVALAEDSLFLARTPTVEYEMRSDTDHRH